MRQDTNGGPKFPCYTYPCFRDRNAGVTTPGLAVFTGRCYTR